tara:strand:- start:25 stop:498 length:474 start_codon:yes stop_codon:yes gene_type:complete
MFDTINLDLLLTGLAFFGSLKLMDTGITYPDPNTLPKAILGHRLCKLVQYPDNDSWLLTSIIGKSIAWRGATIAFSTWVPGQARVANAGFQISGWLNEANGWTDELLMELVKDGVGFVYLHESGDHAPMTVSEYEDWLAENAPKIQTTSEQPQVSAG